MESIRIHEKHKNKNSKIVSTVVPEICQLSSRKVGVSYKQTYSRYKCIAMTIDHIVTNDSTHVIYPIIFPSDLTDHYSIACCVTRDPKFLTELI